MARLRLGTSHPTSSLPFIRPEVLSQPGALSLQRHQSSAERICLCARAVAKQPKKLENTTRRLHDYLTACQRLAQALSDFANGYIFGTPFFKYRSPLTNRHDQPLSVRKQNRRCPGLPSPPATSLALNLPLPRPRELRDYHYEVPTARSATYIAPLSLAQNSVAPLRSIAALQLFRAPPPSHNFILLLISLFPLSLRFLQAFLRRNNAKFAVLSGFTTNGALPIH